MNWYYALNGQQQGPVAEQDIVQLVAAGTINANTLIWKEGLPDWQPVSVALPMALSTAGEGAPQIGGFAVPAAQKDLVVQQMREGVAPTIAGVMDYAGFWIRFAAKFIDGLILMIPNLAVQFTLMGSVGAFTPKANGEPDPAALAAALGSMAINMAVQVLYNSILVSKYGATWGKMAVGLKIVNDDGSKVSTGKAVGRVFAELLSSLTCSIGYIIAAFDQEKRSLHDHICSTRVIKAK